MTQQFALDDLNRITDLAIAGQRKSQNYLCKLWDNESWPSIKAKLLTQGSAWYVWWMDGVQQHLCNITTQKKNYCVKILVSETKEYHINAKNKEDAKDIVLSGEVDKWAEPNNYKLCGTNYTIIDIKEE